MGIPAAFRWLSNKYPKIISPVIEQQPQTMEDGTVIPVDTTGPNPNGEEFDNLYLDMNGIVHPCSHPEDRPAPKDEEEMMLEVFKYTDRVVNMVRPRKLLMIAVDGVAPRAKMNQQRSRRFRSAQEAKEKEEDKKELLKLLKQQNGGVLPAETIESAAKKAFDSNSITPGTPFMDILAASLRYWCAYKLNSDPAWAKMKIIISDASVPGEGEHKIMSFVRSQRASPDHDPNTRHVIYGLDADLIMLSLATHEPHFRVLREDVFFQDSKSRLCKLCGQKGHEASACRGEAKEKQGAFDEKDNEHPLKPFIWLHVSVLREYLAVELAVRDLPFQWDLERAIDDWIFLCCFVGNDFLPHLPALEIRENGINTLTALWKDNLPYMNGYVTKDGHVDLDRAQVIMSGLAKQEDGIFRRRKQQDDRREEGAKRRRMQDRANNERGGGGGFQRADKRMGGDNRFAQSTAGLSLHPIANFPTKAPKAVTYDQVINRGAANTANKSAAAVLKERIQGLMAQEEAKVEADKEAEAKEADKEADTKEAETKEAEPKEGTEKADEAAPEGSPPSALGKRKAAIMEAEGGSETSSVASGQQTPASSASENEGPVDTVRMWEEGYGDRYYEQKFHVDPKDIAFRHGVARSYVEGLSWVLLYYFQGCPSWEWYYPYHYAPFAADFVDLGKLELKFEKGRISRPFEQLMSVLPAASRHAIPEVFHDLMTNEDSEIIDFYPEDFEIDLNGKKFAWQGVALLPFINMERLLAAVTKKYPELSEEDKIRNGVGKVVMLLSDANTELYDEITSNFYSKRKGSEWFTLDPRTSAGLSGRVGKLEDYIPHGSLVYPLDRSAFPDIDYDRSMSVIYEFPNAGSSHKSMLLRGAKLPDAVLTHNDKEMLLSKGQRNGRSYYNGGGPLHTNSNSGYYNDRNRDLGYNGRGGNNRRDGGFHNNRPPRYDGGGGRGGPMSYAPSGPPRQPGGRPDRPSYSSNGQGGQGGQGGQDRGYYAPPQGWTPPPPPDGYRGRYGGPPGVPPAPPSQFGGRYGGGGGNGNGSGSGNGSGNGNGGWNQGYQGGGHQSHQGYQGYPGNYGAPPPPPPGYGGSYRPGDNRPQNYRDSRRY